MNHSFQLTGSTGILSLAGTLSIENGAELKASISEALAASENMVLDLSCVESADICCLQLFCSAHRTAARAGKTLELTNSGEGFDTSVKETGYGRHMGCMHEKKKDCLWIDDSGEKTEVTP